MNKIVVYAFRLNYKVGGIIVLHNLAKLLGDHVPAGLYCESGEYYNNFCTKFYEKSDIDDNTIIVYPEVIKGNPLNSKNVVRWILCDVQVNAEKGIVDTWGKNDLVFHYSTFNNKYNSAKIDLLYTLWLNPIAVNTKGTRSGSCHLFKKATRFHKQFKCMHPADSILIDSLDIPDIIKIFQRCQTFYCYDPYSCYDNVALLCGCKVVIYPIVGMSKLDWLKSKGVFQVYLDKRDNLSGIAYGNSSSELEYAEKTLDLAKSEKEDAVQFGKETVRTFVDSVNNYFFGKPSKEYNTVQRVFFTDYLLS